MAAGGAGPTPPLDRHSPQTTGVPQADRIDRRIPRAAHAIAGSEGRRPEPQPPAAFRPVAGQPGVYSAECYWNYGAYGHWEVHRGLRTAVIPIHLACRFGARRKGADAMMKRGKWCIERWSARPLQRRKRGFSGNGAAPVPDLKLGPLIL